MNAAISTFVNTTPLTTQGALRRFAVMTGSAAVLFIWIQIIRAPRGDFPRHWEFGRRFVCGEFLYSSGLDVPYPPAWAMAHAPLTVAPASIAQILVFPLGVAALALVLYLTRRLSRHSLPLASRNQEFWHTALVLLLCSRFIIRDLFEAGPNLLLLALTWGAVFLWLEHREVPAGICLGVATALKCTPGILLGYFLLKRQWKMLLMACAVTSVVTLAPALHMGIPAYADHMQAWARAISPGFIKADPSRAILGQPAVQNIALKPAIADVVQWIWPEPGEKSKVFTRAEPEYPGIMLGLVMALLLLWVGWRFGSAASLNLPLQLCCQCATMLILGLLLSPITWVHHCVSAIPAVYLLVRREVSERRMDVLSLTVFACYLVFIVLLNRSFIGRNLTLRLYEFHVITWLLVALVFLMLRWCASPSEPARNRLRAAC